MAEKKENGGPTLLKEKLKSDNICGIYLFTGEETFNKDFYIDKFRNRFADNPMAEFNLFSFDGRDTPLNTILTAIESYPVMSDYKLIIIKDSGIFKSVPDNEKAIWMEIFKNPPDYAVIIFDESETDGRSGLLKKIKENGIYVEFNYLSRHEMASWIELFLKKRDYYISKEAINELINRAGESMGAVFNEMNKLVDYCGENRHITEDNVRLIVARSLQDKIFDMLDNVILGNRDAVFSCLYDLKLLREEPVKIISLLGNSITGITKTKLFLSTGSSNIAGDLGIAPFIAKKYIIQSKLISMPRLKEMLACCTRADREIKIYGYDKWVVLETLIIELSSKQAADGT
ncbi:MAG: DNA polymerase III subunit delta [Bacillota bacterium]|nr:DNA polymerase III subunit delta [Bacillota bacterium]